MSNISPNLYQLRPEIIQNIRTSRSLKAQLIVQLEISPNTLQLWLNSNHGNFTLYGCLEIISDHFDSNNISELVTICH